MKVPIRKIMVFRSIKEVGTREAPLGAISHLGRTPNYPTKRKGKISVCAWVRKRPALLENIKTLHFLPFCRFMLYTDLFKLQKRSETNIGIKPMHRDWLKMDIKWNASCPLGRYRITLFMRDW